MRSYVSVLHYDGTSWNPMPAPPTGPLLDVRDTSRAGVDAVEVGSVFVASRR